MAVTKATIQTPELQQLTRGFDRLLDDLRPGIVAGEFGCVIGDDTNGRIPARIVHTTINAWNARHGFPRIPIIFVQGTSDPALTPKLEQALDDRAHLFAQRVPGKNALVVTDGMNSGRSIAMLGEQLTKRGIPFDVAALDGQNFDRTGGGGGALVARSEITAFVETLHAADGLQPISRAMQYEIWDVYHKHDCSLASVTALLGKLRAGTAQKADMTRVNQDRNHPPIYAGPDIAVIAIAAAKITQLDPMQVESFKQLLLSSDFEEVKWGWLEIGYDGKKTQESMDWARSIARPRDLNAPDERLDAVGWPRTTRLFRGLCSAVVIRDRPDLTGLSLEKFSDTPVYLASPEDRGRIHLARDDAHTIARWFAARLELSGAVVPELIWPIAELFEQLLPAIRADEYGVIVGDDTSGRIPTLMLGKAINIYRTTHGLPRIPILFIEGINRPHTAEQIAWFQKLLPTLTSVAPEKRALIVTERVGYGKNVRSIMERLQDAGFSSDVASFGGASSTVLQDLVRQGIWRPGTRAYTGNGNPEIVMNNSQVTVAKTRKDIARSVGIILDEFGLG